MGLQRQRQWRLQAAMRRAPWSVEPQVALASLGTQQMRGDDKQQLEAFRVQQHSGPHLAVAAAASAAAGVPPQLPDQPHVTPDADRVILHFDADSFYAQVEEVRDPGLRWRPVGITQKYLIVTCNYPARAHGVTKLMGVVEARRRCPHIVLVSGEDLTPYRAACKQILVVLQRYGTAEKLGLDEIYVDVTAEAKRRLAALAWSGGSPPAWQGHVHRSGTELVQDSRHRPMDLRAVAGKAGSGGAGALGAGGGGRGGAAAIGAGKAAASGAAATGGVALAGPLPANGSGVARASWEALLRIGSTIAAEARAAVRCEAGYRTSAGVACNKMLAKLVGGLHKPDDQTVLPPPEAAAFVAPLPVRALPGVGYKTEAVLAAAGVATAADLRALPRHRLVQCFGERVGAFLHAACRGKDPSPVQEIGPPKTITVEDSFKSCPGFAAIKKVVSVLAPDLLARLREEMQESGRRPATLTVKWRHRGSGWQRSSASCAVPTQVLSCRGGEDAQVAAVAAAAMGLLRRHLEEPFDLSLINLGATAFSKGPTMAGAAGSRNIADMFTSRTVAMGAVAAVPAANSCPQWDDQAVPSLQQKQHTAAKVSSGGRVAAEASAHQRRSYSSAPAQTPLLSKRAERQLREQGAPQQQEQQQPRFLATGSPSPALQQQQQVSARWQAQQQEWETRYGFGEEEEEEAEEEVSMWQDLQDLAAWRGGGNKRCGPQAGGAPSAEQQDAAAAAAGGSRCQPPPTTAGRSCSPIPAAQQWQQQQQQQTVEATQQGEQQEQQMVREVPQATKQACAAAGSWPATYRNAEALAIRQMFRGDGGSGCGSASAPGKRLVTGGSTTASDAVSAAPTVAAALTDLSPEERASLELALRLQQEEVHAAAVAAMARKRGAAGGSSGTGGGRRKKQQRRGASGPLDAFLRTM